MSSIIFRCPKCFKSLAADEKYAGVTVECVDCSAPIVIPNSSIVFTCPSCNVQLAISANDTGTSLTCPDCNFLLNIPPLDELPKQQYRRYDIASFNPTRREAQKPVEPKGSVLTMNTPVSKPNSEVNVLSKSGKIAMPKATQNEIDKVRAKAMERCQQKTDKKASKLKKILGEIGVTAILLTLSYFILNVFVNNSVVVFIIIAFILLIVLGMILKYYATSSIYD